MKTIQHEDAMLILMLTMRELHHWMSIASMSLQSHCGEEEDGCMNDEEDCNLEVSLTLCIYA